MTIKGSFRTLIAKTRRDIHKIEAFRVRRRLEMSGMWMSVTILLSILLANYAFAYRISTSRIVSRLQLRMVESTDLSTQGKTALEVARRRSVPGKSWLKCRPVAVSGTPGSTVMTNDDFATFTDTSDAWIAKRTGIRSRHLLQKDEQLRGLAMTSAQKALAQTGLKATDIDLVIVATSSPEDLFGDAASIAHGIGAKNAAAFDVTAACAGFLFGSVTAAQFLHSGAYKRALVIGADALSRFVDWKDRGSCILFGDGAGAMVWEATTETADSGLLGFALHSDGSGQKHLNLAHSSSFSPLPDAKHTEVDLGAYDKIRMNGAEVYKFAVTQVPQVIMEALENAGLTPEDVDHYCLHQANARILAAVAQSLGIEDYQSRFLQNLDEVGNTSAASIPLCLSQFTGDSPKRLVKKGDVVVLAGFGAGLSWGAAVLRWAGP